jgi:hypothetical protein
VQNFKVYVSVFSIGNYIFLSSIRKYSWTLVNLIVFIAIAFIPYQSFKINFLGVTEGETTKGSYDEYSLMFPTDYEKQNPLTRKSAMIKYFKKLEQMNLIDKYQSQILINEIQKEDILTNYYKTSRNVANVLNSYEFQRQFVKSKKRYKFIKEFRRRQKTLNSERDKDKDKDILDYDIDKEFDKRFRIRGFSSHIKRSQNRLNELNMQGEIGKNKINNKDNDNKDEESNLGFNKKYNVNVLIDNDKYKNKRASVYMRKALFKRIKDEGIYSDSEEESEDESFDSESYVTDTYRKKTSLEENSINSNKDQMNTIKEEDKIEDNSSSIEHRYNVNENNGADNMLIDTDLVRNRNSAISNKKPKGILKKRAASNENITYNKVTFNLQN